jgi:hypothetical protein
MKPEEFGRRFGIGVRVAGRVARQRIESGNASASAAGSTAGPVPASLGSSATSGLRSERLAANGRLAGQSVGQSAGRAAGKTARAAGRGVAGFLKPFRRVGGILWLEVTGFFFGLFAVGFGISLWRAHQDYASGPHHQQFLIATGLTAVFAYLSISAFWRARKR